jgi:hypothetical protein
MGLLKAFAREVQSVKSGNRQDAERAKFLFSKNKILSWRPWRLGG